MMTRHRAQHSARRHLPRSALALGIVVALTAITGGAAAAVTTTQDDPSRIAATERVSGPQFLSGTDVEVAGSVDGDVYAAGQNVTVSGRVTGDVIAAAQTVTVTGEVAGNVRLAAQGVVLSGTIRRSASIAASTVSIVQSGSVGEDLVAAANTVSVAGDLRRDARLSVDRLTVAGTIGGDVVYVSDHTAQIRADHVDGSVQHVRPNSTTDRPTAGEAFASWLVSLLYALIALSLITLAAGLLVPRQLIRVTDRLRAAPWKAALVGFVAAVAAPPALLLLLVTVIGAPLALVGSLVLLLLTLAAFPYSAFMVGRLVLRDRRGPVVTALLGGAVLVVALHIPVLGVLVTVMTIVLGLGAQLLDIADARPWERVVRRTDVRRGESITATPGGAGRI
ncbi:polymer-forming cytoskeletal protein [Curtobacterium sp. Csp1]|uniref:polymer-forming cytoskeletal protein n=1 Tax=Curtobacterium sp. Csp1 TaxID=2495429 RepID=UPI0015991130|nr:polymer-forming cytoskeletal protein [Curtobacterium sp. Csp1]QKS18699.1 polymer-forming cytoskeletal protein [Curtobacterium sp. Csp1]